MKLTSMTDFVLKESCNKDRNSIDNLNTIFRYALFLKQPLELWMFVPCAVDGEVLEHPKEKEIELSDGTCGYSTNIKDSEEYQQAKERCLFDFHIKNAHHEILFHNDTIEDLVGNGFILTSTAIKKIGL
jgi:hypothetical protein